MTVLFLKPPSWRKGAMSKTTSLKERCRYIRSVFFSKTTSLTHKSQGHRKTLLTQTRWISLVKFIFQIPIRLKSPTRYNTKYNTWWLMSELTRCSIVKYSKRLNNKQNFKSKNGLKMHRLASTDILNYKKSWGRSKPPWQSGYFPFSPGILGTYVGQWSYQFSKADGCLDSSSILIQLTHRIPII